MNDAHAAKTREHTHTHANTNMHMDTNITYVRVRTHTQRTETRIHINWSRVPLPANFAQESNVLALFAIDSDTRDVLPHLQTK